MHRIVAIKLLGGYSLEIEFSDGLKKVIDLTPYIGDGLSAALLEDAYFRQVAIESGCLLYTSRCV